MATELRLHGVSGAFAEALLDRPLLAQVAGDDQAGFYRPRAAYGDITGAPGTLLEAYRWANLTKFTTSRALWLLLLLPLLLSNVAIWMRPATRGSSAAAKALCRVFAATLTIMFVLSAVGISLDLVGWQCAPYAHCTAGRPYLSWLTDLPPGRRLALLALAPIVAIRVLWWLGSRTWESYEAFGSFPQVRGRGEGLDAVAHWDGMASVGRLRSLHVTVAFATLDASLLAVLAPHDRNAAGYTLAAVTVAVAVAGLVLLSVPGVVERDVEVGWADPATRGLRRAALGLTALTLAYAAAPRPAWPVTGPLPGFEAMVTWLLVAQSALLVALGAVVLWQPRARPSARVFLHGLAAPVVNSLAIGLAIVLTAGLAHWVADFLDRGGTPRPSNAVPTAVEPLQPLVSYQWSALGFTAAVLAAALAALYLWRVTLPRQRRVAAQIAARDFPDAPPEAAPRLRDVPDAIASARMTERMGPLLVAYASLVVLGLSFTGLALANAGPIDVAARLGGEGSRATRLVSFATDLGTYFIGFFAIGLLAAGLLAYRYTGLQRVIGVLWDLGTFWPRDAHPLAPPCYAERVVPELCKRISFLAGQGGVVLSGHSHGGVLMAAVVLQLPPETLRRVALLTYGSPLRRLNTQLFPAYVNDDVLRAVGDRVGWRWRNLWRDTDPTGGWIFSPHRAGEPPKVEGPPDEVDSRLRDPRGLMVEPHDTVPPPINGHWYYQRDERFAAARRELLTRLGERAG